MINCDMCGAAIIAAETLMHYPYVKISCIKDKDHIHDRHDVDLCAKCQKDIYDFIFTRKDSNQSENNI